MLPVTAAIAARAAALDLSKAELQRYSRHLLLPEVGKAGQCRLQAAKVLVIGAGGLGAPVTLYLAAAGIGTLGLVEFDRVDASNLQRQILYSEADIGAAKCTAAARRLRALNSGITVVEHGEALSPDNAEALISGYDIVIDGTDNFATRYLANDCCYLLGKPYVYGAIFRFAGQTSVFYAPHGPCYRCLFPSPPPAGQVPSCAEGGVFGVLPGQIGTIQATEALKLILGHGEPLLGRLLTYDALSMRFRELRLGRDPGCPLCGDRPTILRPAASSASCGLSTPPPSGAEITVAEYYDLRTAAAPHVLIDVRSAEEADICRIGGSLLLPLPTLEARLAELPTDVPLIVHCKSGARSARAVALLHAKGFSTARSLKGGILAWIASQAPELPTY